MDIDPNAPKSSNSILLIFAVGAALLVCGACVFGVPIFIIMVDQTNSYCLFPFGDQFFYCP